ncbi:hypothetical protein GWI33_020933 [Rhynchophorus ferrugineus]|uniref:RING-type domain-containing protein n=1 Tax=Rhynchophorus ferrugineus TaxID=354439 RepID=A0A834HRG1_RHYFE|nr:hypothetical protein GWI33_020933 [Rhynchophorus ferrugineus]
MVKPSASVYSIQKTWKICREFVDFSKQFKIMDESVVFVKRVRERDSDVYVIENDNLLPENNKISSGRNRNFNSIPVAYIDLSDETTQFISKDSQVSSELNNSMSFECSICLRPFQCLELKSLKCGHVYCTDCINKVMQKGKVKCAKCRKITFNKHLRPVFL